MPDVSFAIECAVMVDQIDNDQSFNCIFVKLYFPSSHSSWKSAPAGWVTYSESQGRMRKWRWLPAPGPQHGRWTSPPFPEKDTCDIKRSGLSHPKKWWKIREGLQLDHHHLERLTFYRISLIFCMVLMQRNYCNLRVLFVTITMARVICPALIP